MRDSKGSDLSQKAVGAEVPEYMPMEDAIDCIVQAQMVAKGLPTSAVRREKAAQQKDLHWSRTSVDEMIIEREVAESIALAVTRGALRLFSPRSLLPLTHKLESNDPAYLDALVKRDELLSFARAHLRIEPSSNPPAGSRRWTEARIAEVRAMRDEMKTNGVRDYARRTAKQFGISTTLLRRLLAADTSKNVTPFWPAHKTKTWRPK